MSDNRPAFDEMYCASCGSIVKIRAELCMRCGVRVSGRPQRSPGDVTDEVRLTQSTFASGQTECLNRVSRLPVPLAVLVAIGGSFFGIFGVFQAELPVLGVLAAWLWAPVIEEVFKPTGIYILLVKWPGTLSSRFFTALLSALAGVTFGLLESTVYMTIYFPVHTQEELVFRFTVPVMLHTLTSFIFGLGINEKLLTSFRSGGPFHFSNWVFFLGAILTHSLYNVTVTVLGVLSVI